MKVPDTKENLMKCICMKCPTHNKCMKDNMQGLFCARGKSSCDFSKNGCLCGECPVGTDYKLKEYYYCEVGPAK
jgi:hypothetical protein